MADWPSIRRLARERRARVAANSPALAAAENLLDTALDREGLWRGATAADDPSLAGAQAVLNREAQGILYNSDLPSETVHFNLAHEMAHWWLHDETAVCGAGDIVPDPVAEPLPFGQDSVSGYSPAQRREVEANVFAAEFLLPAPVLRDALLRGTSPAEIARAVGVSESAVVGQMAETLLLGDEAAGTTHEGAATERAEAQHSSPSLLALDESQRVAAEADRGPVLVIAGPGTGKTRTLVARVLILLDRGSPPEQILALTFSNRAANEMRERLAAVVPDAARRLWIGTFHAFGLELLRRFGDRLGLPPRPVLLDPLDAIALMEKRLADLDLHEYEYLHNPTFPFRDILGAISRAKDELVTPERYAELVERMEEQSSMESAVDPESRIPNAKSKAREVARVYRDWQRILEEEGKLDFGDLLMRSVTLLEQYPEVREQVCREYQHVLVDEYQDINRASAVLVKLLAADAAGLWAVGDLRQAIYRFRGASPANVTHFENDFPAGRRLTLNVNYRSRPAIVGLFGAAAQRMGTGADLPPLDPPARSSGSPEPVARQESALTDDPASRGPSPWQPQRPAHPNSVTLAEADSEAAQADGIVDAIHRFEADGIPLNEQAILCRTNSQAEQMAGALEARGVPTLYLGNLLARPEIRDMLSLLSLVCEGHGQGLVRVARFPEYAIPTQDVLEVLARAGDDRTTVLRALASTNSPAVRMLHQHLAPIAYQGDAYAFFARYLFGPGDYLRRLLRQDDVQSRQSRIALYQLLALARGFAARLIPGENDPRRAFLDYVRALVATQEDSRVRLPSAADDIPGVRLMTVHGSKGLEFSVVFLPNLARDLFPARGRSGVVKLPVGLVAETNETDAVEEERLFFVAMSRARDHLVLSRPRSVNGKQRAPSPLLDLIAENLDACGAQRVEWRESGIQVLGYPGMQARTHEGLNARTPEGLNARTPEGLNAEYPISAVEQYMRCPRQYYYQRVLKLPAAEAESAYRGFQECVWNVIRWVRAEKSAGRSVLRADAEQRLAEAWERFVPADHAHTPLLRTRASDILGHFCASETRESPSAVNEILADLPSGRIRIRLDHASETADGVLRVERYDSGRPAEDDHTAPRLALTRHAARQAGAARGARSPVEIHVRYLTTGETRAIPEQPRWEPNRVAKYENALQGIRSHEFPARPSQEQCPRCPFYFLCPL